MKTNHILTMFATLAAVSCDRVQLPKGQSSAPYLSILEQGLTGHFGVNVLPVGKVEILSELSSQMESGDVSRQTYPIQYLQRLHAAQSAGLVTLKEKQQDELQAISNMGRRFITVSPTDKLLKLETPPYNNANTAVGFSFVSVGTMKVTEVLKEEEHKVPGAKPGDEFRIVLGKMRETPTPAAKELAALGANTEPRELKFRAILQFNPFAKTYTYVTADYGKPEDAGWLTNNIQ